MQPKLLLLAESLDKKKVELLFKNALFNQKLKLIIVMCKNGFLLEFENITLSAQGQHAEQKECDSPLCEVLRHIKT